MVYPMSLKSQPNGFMDAAPPPAEKTDPGLASLTLLLRFYGVGADGEQILHQLGTRTIGKTEMLASPAGTA
jgi:nucleotidyltransferase/DNA polymerase involved in DNA repair